MQSDTKITNTSGFLSMAKAGAKMGYNRQVNLETLTPVIDPEGMHVESYRMLHEHKEGVSCEPHFRSLWMVKIVGQKAPVTLIMDTTIEAYEFNTMNSSDLPSEKDQEDMLDQQIMEKLQNA